MAFPAIPPWMIVEHGSAPIIVLAPHGGRRLDPRIPGEHKVNDLHTADLARELAALLGASVVINAHVDRNALDLNRRSQVRRDAPWMIELLGYMLREKVATDGHATVLVVHGWNVSQVACDLGIGMRETPEGLVAVRPGSATVSDAFVATRLRPLQHDGGAEGVAVTIGSRYPAAHPNNLLQMFRAESDDASGGCPIATLCGAATVDAVQLELTIPLRWPGRRRERFLQTLARRLGAAAGPVAGFAPSEARMTARSGRITRRRTLQFLAGDCLVMAAMDAADEGPIGARLVVSESADRLTLFTGEISSGDDDWSVAPLACRVDTDGSMRVAFEGPMIRFPHHRPFVDLERGLAEGVLIEARLDAVFAPGTCEHCDGAVERVGSVRGELVVDGRRCAIATAGVATTMDGTAKPRMLPGRIALLESPVGVLTFDVQSIESTGPRDHSVELSGYLWRDGGRVSMCARAGIGLGADDGMLVLQCPEAALAMSAPLERLIPVWRPGPHGTLLETTFATVRTGGRAIGWLELSTLQPLSAGPR